MCAEVSQQGVILVGRLLLPDAFASCCASNGESSASSIASGELTARTTHVDIIRELLVEVDGNSPVVPSGGAITWTSDGSVIRKGWKICTAGS